jgi:hypothetical protein
MLKNPACPNYFVGKDFEDYQRYRYFAPLILSFITSKKRLYVLYRLKNLKFLDYSPG